MSKIKEHHNLERQIGDWQIGLAWRSLFTRDGVGKDSRNRAAPFLSLCPLLFPIISPALHWSPVCEVHIKARVSATVASFSSIQKATLVQAGQACPALGCLLPLALQKQQHCLTLGEAAPSVFQWNIWCAFSFHTIMLFNSSTVLSSLFSLKSTRVFSFC